MTAQVTHWMEYGEPTDDGNRVEATKRITYMTGPNERPRDDDVTHGTIPMDALDAWEDHGEAAHDDGSLELSALDDDAREELEDAFEPNKPEFEVTKAEYKETQEWEFRADVRARLKNPKGTDVVLVGTFEIRPKVDDLVQDPEEMQVHINYWEPNSYPADGDRPFWVSKIEWVPSSDIDDDEALLDECKRSLTHDPEATLEMLRDEFGDNFLAPERDPKQ